MIDDDLERLANRGPHRDPAEVIDSAITTAASPKPSVQARFVVVSVVGLLVAGLVTGLASMRPTNDQVTTDPPVVTPFPAPTANTPTPPQQTEVATSPSSDAGLPNDGYLVFGLSTDVGLAFVNSGSLEVSPLASSEPLGIGRGQLSPMSPERFVVSAGVESNGFVPCDSEIIKVDNGSVTARASGFHSATYSVSHDLIAAIRLGEWYSEGQCVGESVVLLDRDLDVVSEIDRGDDDGVPPAFKSVVWTETGSLIVVVDQLSDLVDQYAPGRSDLLVYEMRSGLPERVSFLRNPGDEVWTSAAASADELLLVSATTEGSLVRTVAIDELGSVFQDGASWSEMTDVREYDGFVFSAIGLPNGGMMVSLLSDSPAADVVISSQSDGHELAGLSGLAAIPADFVLSD